MISGFRRDDVQITRGLGDLGEAVAVRSVGLLSGSGDQTIYTPPSNALFLVYSIVLFNNNASARAVVLKSGSATIGNLYLLAATSLVLGPTGFPLAIGRDKGDAFVVNVASDVHGLFTVGWRVGA